MVAVLALAAALAGLHGTVTAGPTQPVCRAGEPCTAPVEVTLLFRPAILRDGSWLPRPRIAPTAARSDAAGRYRVVLAPGFYTVTIRERIGLGRTPTPHAVHVRRGHVDRLDFEIDTGIR